MKIIASIKDLEDYGIKYLTGESCNLAFRGLYDLTERGRDIVCNALNLRPSALADNVNPGSKSDPHVASIMLTLNQALDIGLFALINAGCHPIALTKYGSLIGIEEDESLRNNFKRDPEDPDKITNRWELTRDGYTQLVDYIGITRVVQSLRSHAHCSKTFRNFHAASGGYL